MHMRLIAFLLVAASAALGQSPAADTLFVHGDILTGAHLTAEDTDPIAARVTALAVAHGLIVAAGTDAEILKLKTASTQVVDLHGAFAMPGFNDAHTHIASAGRQHFTVDLDGATSLADMLARIRAFAATAPANAWLEGSGWDHTKWPGATLP